MMKMSPNGSAEVCKEIALYLAAIDEIRRKRTNLECEIKRLKSEYNESLAINRLLAGRAHLIFKWLSFNDLLVCEQTCQAWHRHVRQLNITKLVISKRLRPDPKIGRITKIRPRKWFFCNEDEPYFPSSPMQFSNCSTVKLENSFLLGLRQLKICDKSLRLFYDEEKLNQPLLIEAKFLNELVKLETLEIARVQFDLDKTLRLPELKYLTIGQAESGIVIDCPKLTHYRHKKDGYEGVVQFLRPESVTHLYTTNASLEYEKLKNLQYMCLIKSDFQEVGSYAKYRAIDFLSSYRQLKELSLRPPYADGYGYKSNRGSFLQLLKQKRIFKRDDLALIFYGIHLTNATQLENADKDACAMLSKLYIRNCTKLCKKELHWIRSLHYTAMMAAARQKPIKIPLDIHQRLFNVRRIVLNGEPNDEEHFFRFVNGFRKLVTFCFEGKVPEEAFFERLAINCTSNWYVELEFDKEATIKHLAQFDFIFKFKNLASLSVYRDFKNAFIKRIFERFASFELQFYIKRKSSLVKIVRKSRSSKHEYAYKSNECRLFDSLDDLLKEMNEQFEREDDPDEEEEKSNQDSESDENQETDSEDNGEEDNGAETNGEEDIGEDHPEEEQEDEAERKSEKDSDDPI